MGHLEWDDTTQEKLRKDAKVMGSLAHPTRLFIVEALAKKERQARELAEMMGQSTASLGRHLALLEETGIILSHRTDGRVVYTLRLTCVHRFLRCVDSSVEAQEHENFLRALGYV